ncbi:unnamed protein product [Rotaria sp. Silwood2]|nr:unnamed protein product [Rotaria sp. Silwood2]CAF2996990.1 unnamed protein product [Rotaria sp. Silwood2]CAF3167737.1 unnamed protein product [Rotaria sp. Silwood2]CAF3991145.1 unnamed protein product [Rotaria sp. Silwood2]CAF4121148.1 unnamed protein product [Rotaria sp. Silwood2]
MTDEIEPSVQNEEKEEKKLSKLNDNEEKDEKQISVLKDGQEKEEKKMGILKNDLEKVEAKLSKLDDDEEYDYITVPPDGGFGWVVLVACFLINLIIDGFIYAFGAISNDLRDHFKCQEWASSLIIGLAGGFYMLSAPVASALCNKWGCRRIGIIGSVIAACAIAASIFSPHIVIMWLLFGVIAGTGMGFIYLPSIVMVGYYFEEKRAIATGIVTAGTGVGIMGFGPLARLLFNLFRWKLGLFLMALIVLCCALCCAFMRPLQPIRKRRVLPLPEKMDYVVQKVMTPASSIKGAKVAPTIVIIPSPQDEEQSLPDVILEDDNKRRSRTASGVSNKSRHSIRAEDAVRPLYKEDVLYQGDTRDLPEFQSQPDIPTYVQQTTKVPETVDETKMKAFWDVLLAMTNIHLLRDKKMMIICVANVFSMVGYYIPFLFIVDFASSDRNIPRDTAVFLLTCIGVTNTISRFASGWVTKIPFMSPLLVNNIGLTVGGALLFLVPLCRSYFSLICICLMWGGFAAFHISLSPVIVCQLVGLELYSSALGLSLMFRGVAVLAGPPLMGAIRDITSSFSLVFVIGGFTLIISALMHFSLMWMERSNKVEVHETNKAKASQENPVASGV